jgi:hypothetical protein
MGLAFGQVTDSGERARMVAGGVIVAATPGRRLPYARSHLPTELPSRQMLRLLTVLAPGLFFALATAPAVAQPLAAVLAALAPEAPPAVIKDALTARACAIARGLVDPAAHLAVIDFGQPSTEPRLWVFDIVRGELLFAEHVAHGRGSGGQMADTFSNVEGSHQSSLGLFVTAESYTGANGYSLRLDGLEPGLNDRARERAIVVHGAAYVDPLQALRQGRLGRSFGCPAVRPAIARPLIDTLRDGQLLFAHHPDAGWRRKSRLLDCDGAGAVAGRGGGSRATP